MLCMTRPNAAKLALVSLLVALPLSSAMAGGLSAVINGKSIHVDATRDWNEKNYGLGLEYQFATESRWKKQLMVNGFRDSSEEMSYMAGAGIHRRLLQSNRFSDFYIDAGVTAFFMTREDIDDNEPFPGVLPSVTFGNRYVGFNLSYIPKSVVHDFANANEVDPDIDGVLFLQFKVRLDRWILD